MAKTLSLCCYKVCQTQQQALDEIERIKINFTKTVQFKVVPRTVEVMKQDITVWILVALDYEAPFMNTAEYCKVRKDIVRAGLNHE